MAGENEKVVLEVKEAVDALRVKMEKYGQDSSEYKEMLDKTQKAIEKDEAAHQKMVAELAEVQKKALEQEERLKDFELQVAKKQAETKVDYKTLPEYKALNEYAKFGKEGMDPELFQVLSERKAEQIKTMRMDNGVSGGYITDTEMDSSLIKTITEISPVRQVCRVKTISKKTLEIPKRTGIPTAYYEGEAEQNELGQSQYGNETLTAYRLSVTVPYTMDLLADSMFDLESEIRSDVSEAFAYKEGNKFVLGTGAKEPEGFLVNAEVIANARTSASSGAVSGDDLMLLTGDLKVGYNPMYAFNRQTLAYLRTLKGTDGHYLWQAGLAPNVPNTINGERYIIFQDMPSVAAGNYAVIYADFMRGYTITDRMGLVVIRDEVTQARNAIINLTFHKWNTGQVVLSEAFKLLIVKS